MIPVSYTHLDVYKRQDVIRADRRDADALTAELLHEGKILGFGVADDDVCLLYTSPSPARIRFAYTSAYRRRWPSPAPPAGYPAAAPCRPPGTTAPGLPLAGWLRPGTLPAHPAPSPWLSLIHI